MSTIVSPARPPAHPPARPLDRPPEQAALPRALVAVSIAAGALYPLVEGRFGAITDVVAKGVCVAALALAALLLRGRNGRWLAAIMAAGALGDMLLEVPGGFLYGAGSFAIGHVIAMALYVRNRRQLPAIADGLVAAVLIAWGFAMPRLMAPASDMPGGLTLYAVLLCGMAATAWSSRFDRRLTAAGALLFVVSDSFLVMRLGGTLVGGATVHGLIVWYSYYVGQLLIFTGVTRGLACSKR